MKDGALKISFKGSGWALELGGLWALLAFAAAVYWVFW